MEQKQSIDSRTISTDRLYTSIELANWLFEHDIMTVRTSQKGRQCLLSELFDTKDRDEFIPTCHFEKVKKNFCLTSYTVEIKTRTKNKLLCCQHLVLYMGKRSMILRRNH